MKRFIFFLFILPFVSCTQTTDNEQITVSVTIPTQKYFLDRLAGDYLNVNVLVPPEVGHSTYSPKPRQMVELSKSDIYFALGSLDFELTWKERMMANSTMRWVDLSTDNGDPHYWISPQKAMNMARNIASELKPCLPPTANIDSSLNALLADIQHFDDRLKQVTAKGFFIFHPAFTYLQNDYAIRQFSAEHNGSSSPKSFAENLDSAKFYGVKVVFLQSESDREKAETAAEYLDARIVKITPEAYDWTQTMQTIIDALQ